jgi:hypothetical protein
VDRPLASRAHRCRRCSHGGLSCAAHPRADSRSRRRHRRAHGPPPPPPARAARWTAALGGRGGASDTDDSAGHGRSATQRGTACGEGEEWVTARPTWLQGLAACACFDRPASLRDPPQTNRGQDTATTPPSALVARSGPRVLRTETVAERGFRVSSRQSMSSRACQRSKHLLQATRPSKKTS